MSFLESDWTYWGLGLIIAIASLVRLATRRRQQLSESLRGYVARKQGTSSESNDSP